MKYIKFAGISTDGNGKWEVYIHTYQNGKRISSDFLTGKLSLQKAQKVMEQFNGIK